jgi:hypothetical protein
MSLSRKKRNRAVILAFLTVCVILISLIGYHEMQKYRSLQEFSRTVPEFTNPAFTQKILFHEKFDDTSLMDWKEDIRSGSTDYKVLYAEDGNAYLKAETQGTASVMVKKLYFEPERYPYLKWKWRVETMPAELDMNTKAGSDAPARIYVVFSNGVGIWNLRMINYVWASSMAKGSILNSFFTKNSKIVVLQSGDEFLGQWIPEARNILEDYRNLFGEEPPNAQAVAFMTDMDDSKEHAVAFFDDILVSSQP